MDGDPGFRLVPTGLSQAECHYLVGLPFQADRCGTGRTPTDHGPGQPEANQDQYGTPSVRHSGLGFSPVDGVQPGQ
jgi:hypothetical protein